MTFRFLISLGAGYSTSNNFFNTDSLSFYLRHFSRAVAKAWAPGNIILSMQEVLTAQVSALGSGLQAQRLGSGQGSGGPFQEGLKSLRLSKATYFWVLGAR